MIAKRVFWVPKLGNFLKHLRISENVPELPQNTRGTSQKHPELSKQTRGTSQKHPELPKNTRKFPKTPGSSQKHPELPRTSRELPNTRGTSQKHPGRWWVVGGWVGSHNTRGRSYRSGPDYHVAHITRVNR